MTGLQTIIFELVWGGFWLFVGATAFYRVDQPKRRGPSIMKGNRGTEGKQT